MLKRIVLALALCWSATAAADFFEIDFFRKHEEAQAERLLSERDYEEAREALEALAETADGDVEKALWRARAAIAVGLQDGRFDEGMEMAEAIEDRPYSIQARIELMHSKRDYAGLIEAFGDENIAEWPARRIPPKPRYGNEADARCIALYHRGHAYYQTSEGEAAARDLAKASELAQNSRRKLDIWRIQAANYTQRLGDEEKAFEANMRIAGLGGGGANFYRGVIGAANYLRGQGQHDEALDVLSRMNPYEQRGWWLGEGLIAVGRTLAEAGRTDEAVEAYMQVAETEDQRDRHRSAAYFLAAEALADAGRAEEAIEAYKTLLDFDGASDDHKERADEALGEMER